MDQQGKTLTPSNYYKSSDKEGNEKEGIQKQQNEWSIPIRATRTRWENVQGQKATRRFPVMAESYVEKRRKKLIYISIKREKDFPEVLETVLAKQRRKQTM